MSRSLSTSHCTEDLATKLTDSTKGRTQSLICHYGCCIFPEKLFLYSAENMYSIHTHTRAHTCMGLVCKPSIEGTVKRLFSLIT